MTRTTIRSEDITASEVTTANMATDPTNASNLASGTVPTARLGSGTADATTFLRGDNAWASAGSSAPAFAATGAIDQAISDAVQTKAEIGTEVFDSNSAYDPTTNYRFTVPAGEGGKYYVYADVTFHSTHGGNDLQVEEILVKKNGSTAINSEVARDSGMGITETLYCEGILVLSAADYLEVYGYLDNVQGSTYTKFKSASFGAFKLQGI